MAANIDQRRDELRVRLATNLKIYRGQRGISQEALAGLAGIHRTHISQLERATLNPTLDTLVLIADALGVAEVDLLAIPTEAPQDVPRGPRRSGSASAADATNPNAEKKG
jgi:transcriptional regulator with XRE-family HTH domain